ncbi:protein phosphatase, partial [Streptomyces sp. NPDC047002]
MPVDPAEIPQFTGDLEQLESDVTGLRTNASLWRTSGGDVDSDFQGLSAFYRAPEAEELFATTRPVAVKSDAFATQLESVGAALDAYAGEVRPLAARLRQLKQQA